MTEALRDRARALAADAVRLRTRGRMFGRAVLDRVTVAVGEPPLADAMTPWTGWHDSFGDERPGWRTLAAYLDAQEVFSVGYVVCRRCGLGLVEWPFTDDRVLRCGLATAGLGLLRAAHPRLAWHTLGGHSSAQAFWRAAGTGVRGGYFQWDRTGCVHIRF